MSQGPDRLVELLPLVHRLRDAERGEPLRALLRVIAEQVQVVEDDIAGLYENWFIETCQDWVAPYLGGLVGYRPTGPIGTGRGPTRVLAPRQDVANTIAARRRKGTLALLEQLARDAAGWPARAVEPFTLLAADQAVRRLGSDVAADRLRLARGGTVDLRNGDALDRVDGPFDELAHTVAVARITSTRTRRLHRIPNVAVFVWRLRPYRLTRAPAFCVDRARHHYTFRILGNDAPLLTRPIEEPSATHIADETNVPAFVRRRAFDERTPDYYGPGRSLQILLGDERTPVPLASIVPADLSGWAYRPQGTQVAVDPVLGRIAFSPRQAPEGGVWVTWTYGFADDLGGGEYQRPLRPAGTRPRYQVGPGTEHAQVMDAVRHWLEDKRADPTDQARQDAIVEIVDSGAYEEPIDITLEHGDRLELRAAQGARPVIRLLNWYGNRPDSMRVRGPAAADEQPERPYDGRGRCDDQPPGPPPPQLTLDGLLVTGRAIRVSGSVGRVTIRHCTLVPGWSIGGDCEPENEGEPSLELVDTGARVVVEDSIVGGILVNQNEVDTEPLAVELRDSILDATGPDRDALAGPDGRPAHAVASLVRATVIGRVRANALELAEDAIFDGQVRVSRRQVGCMRFCFVPPGSRTPRRYQCQPDLVVEEVRRQVEAGDVAEAQRDRLREQEVLRVRPRFESRRYGRPAYARLDRSCAPELTAGAHDDAEMGVFHDLFQPQREAGLQARLDEHVPAGMDAGIVFVT
jgi:hypothetical protein